MAPEASPVDRVYKEAAAVVTFLQDSSEVSLQVAAADHFRKAMLLAAASYFEHRVCECVLEYVREHAPGCALVENFVRNKAIARQFHSWFKWDSANANQFFGLFGEEFKARMVARVQQSGDLGEAIRAFLELGSKRNQLVHQDFATFPMEQTLDEIYELYKKALFFVEDLPNALRGRSFVLSDLNRDPRISAEPGSPIG